MIQLSDNPATYPAQITAPAAGEPRDEKALQALGQALANRTAYMKSILDSSLSSSGVRHVQTYATVAALQAVAAASRSADDIAIVAGGALYRWDANSTAVADSVIYVQPTDIVSGAGRWVARLDPSHFGIANGIAQLGADSKLSATLHHNSIVGSVGWTTTKDQESASTFERNYATAWTTSTNIVTPSIALVAGDVVFLSAIVQLLFGGASGTAYARLVAIPSGSGSPIPIGGSYVAISMADQQVRQYCANPVWMVPTSGTFTFALSSYLGTSGSLAFMGAAAIEALVLRP